MTLGLVFAAATATLGPRLIDTRPSHPAPWEVAGEAGYVLPFEPARATVPGAHLDGVQGLLVVAPQGQGPALQAMRRNGLQGNISWQAPRLGTFAMVSAEMACPCVPAEGATLLNATIYVFRAEGTLLASNDEPRLASRFVPDSHFMALPNGTWSLGAAPPPGAVAFPAEWQPVLAQIRPHLAGLAAGAVATFVLEDHPQRNLVGPLHVTLRVESVFGAMPSQAGAAPV